LSTSVADNHAKMQDALTLTTKVNDLCSSNSNLQEELDKLKTQAKVIDKVILYRSIWLILFFLNKKKKKNSNLTLTYVTFKNHQNKMRKQENRRYS